MNDLIAPTQYISTYLHKEKLILIGHSYGTYIATMAASQHPEMYLVCIGIGQMSDTIESELDRGFFGTEYNLTDAIRLYTASIKYQDALITEELNNPITEIVDTLDIPAYFVMGEFDGMTSPKAAENYLNSLTGEAVHEMVMFENSAHYPQLEEPDKFNEWMCSIFGKDN